MSPLQGQSSPSEYEEIVITGFGAVCSLGNSVEEIWEKLISGKSAAAPPVFTGETIFNCIAAQVLNPPIIKSDINPQLAKSMGKHLSLLLKSTEEAMEHAGFYPGFCAPEDIGFFAGMGMVDYRIEELLPAVLKSLASDGEIDYEKFFSGGFQEIYPLWPLGMLNNVAFCQAAIHFGIRGENCVFCTHGDAGVQAVSEGLNVLREQRAKIVLAGGVSEEISPLSLARASLNGLISPSNCDLEKAAADADFGAFLGEGGAMLVLEHISSARKRGVKPLAKVAGFGFACEKDENRGFVTPESIQSAMEAALHQAGLRAEDIDVIMLGSSNCEAEMNGVRRLFFEESGPMILSSDKVLGEMFAAGPVVDVIIGINIISSGIIPQGLHIAEQNPEIDRSADHSRSFLRVLINGISYEGQCGSMIIEKSGCSL